MPQVPCPEHEFGHFPSTVVAIKHKTTIGCQYNIVYLNSEVAKMVHSMAQFIIGERHVSMANTGTVTTLNKSKEKQPFR